MTELERLESLIACCDRCSLVQTVSHKVFGEGDPHAKVMIVGDTPGREENSSGLPFVGDSGKLLDKALAELGIARSSLYVATAIRCWPPGNRKPAPNEIVACYPWLEAQIAAIKPGVIIALGAMAMQTLVDIHSSIGKIRGKVLAGPRETLVVSTWHPSYILRTGGMGDKKKQRQAAKEFLSDLKIAFDVVGVKYTGGS